MSIKLFSDFLVENGKLTKEQINEAISYQAKNNITLSALALSEGFLSVNDLRIINEKQRFYDQKFASMVLDMMLLNTKQLDDLLHKYDQKHISFSDALLKKHFISKDELKNELNSFYEDQKRVSRHIYKEMAFFDRDNLIQDSIATLEKLYLRTTQEVIKLKKIEFTIDIPDEKTVVAQGLEGDESIEYAVVLEDMANIEVARSVLKAPLYDEDENSIDTLTKFLNVFLVNVGVSLVTKDINVELNELQIVNGSKFDLSGYYNLTFLTENGEMSLYIKI